MILPDCVKEKKKRNDKDALVARVCNIWDSSSTWEEFALERTVQGLDGVGKLGPFDKFRLSYWLAHHRCAFYVPLMLLIYALLAFAAVCMLGVGTSFTVLICSILLCIPTLGVFILLQTGLVCICADVIRHSATLKESDIELLS